MIVLISSRFLTNPSERQCSHNSHPNPRLVACDGCRVQRQLSISENPGLMIKCNRHDFICFARASKFVDMHYT